MDNLRAIDYINKYDIEITITKTLDEHDKNGLRNIINTYDTYEMNGYYKNECHCNGNCTATGGSLPCAEIGEVVATKKGLLDRFKIDHIVTDSNTCMLSDNKDRELLLSQFENGDIFIASSTHRLLKAIAIYYSNEHGGL